MCPVRAVCRHIQHLCTHGAPPTAPLANVFTSGAWAKITPIHITTILCNAVSFLGPELGFLPSDVSARCLRAAGATALLNAKVDGDVIKLLGRWHSDAMLRYLHLQAAPIMKDYARLMLTGGSFTLIPNQLVPSY